LPLIKFLKDQKGILASRVNSISDIPLVKTSNLKTPAQRMDLVVQRLRNPKANRPGTLKTLENSINATFQNRLTSDEVLAIREALLEKGHISLKGTKVTYAQPKALH